MKEYSPEFMKKIAKVSQKMQPLKRDTSAFKYKYADLKQIQETLNPVLKEEGLLWFAPIRNMDGRDRVVSIIIDTETGDYLESGMTLPEGLKPQDAGSAVTYYRRYTILSLLNMETEDDDGAKASSSYAGPKI